MGFEFYYMLCNFVTCYNIGLIMGLANNQPTFPMNDYHTILW